MVAEDRPQCLQRLAKVVHPLRPAPPVIDGVDGAQDQRLRTAGGCVAGQRHGFQFAGRVPVVEALKRVDRQDLDTRRHGGCLDVFRRGAVGDLDALEIVADLDRSDAKISCQPGEVGEIPVGRDDMVERESNRVCHRRFPVLVGSGLVWFRRRQFLRSDFNPTEGSASAAASGFNRRCISISARRMFFATLPIGPTPLAAISRPSSARWK